MRREGQRNYSRPSSVARELLRLGRETSLLKKANIMTERNEKGSEARREEIDAIGKRDSERLHGSMNKSGDSEAKREDMQPDRTPNSDDHVRDREASREDSLYGSKRHASAGASPSEPSVTTEKREGTRATITNAQEGSEEDVDHPTHRNDIASQVESKPMHEGSSRKFGRNT